MGEKRTTVERPKLGGAFYAHPLRPQTAIGMDPQDGLPRTTTTLNMTDSLAPALEVETLVCMGDESVFVFRDRWGDVAVTFSPHEARRAGDEFFVKRSDLDQDRVKALSLVERDLREIGWLAETGDNWVKVEPLRPQCVHYRRLMMDFEGTESKHVERVCTAQRSEDGEYLSLNDTRVYACEHRAPRDFVSEERLRVFDRKRLEESKKTEAEWDPVAALAAAQAGENKDG